MDARLLTFKWRCFGGCIWAGWTWETFQASCSWTPSQMHLSA